MTRVSARRPYGFTVLELIIALVVFGAVIVASLGVFKSQVVAFREGTLRMGVLQNVRFTANLLERDLRTMGSGALQNQPFLIYAGEDAVAFNADYATNVVGDMFAVYVDPDAPSGAVMAMSMAQRTTLPGTGMAYPDMEYLEPLSGLNSRAETITLYFVSDASSSRTDDFALYRQVNDHAPELVSRNLVRTGTAAFFKYFRIVTPPDTSAYIEEVPTASLPLAHTVAVHLSPADTGSAARVDEIRGIEIVFTAVDGSGTPDEDSRSISRTIWLPNAGLSSRRTCGDEPILGAAMAANPGVTPDGKAAAVLSWNQAVDEAAGERDVVRYVVWRRYDWEAAFADPYLSIPAGNLSYVYTDASVEPGSTYVYGLAAQDCTPLTSSRVSAAPVTIP